MSIIVYTESEEGKIKKIALEAVSYAKGIADQMGTSVTAITVNANDTSELGKYGASKILEVSNDKLKKFNAEAYADAIAQAAKKEDAKVIVLSTSA
ncbi:MAG TPA: electron transfer flavoprotein subunit alpha, partial [Aequorivita sp.]|nr:electron transfer flavoprotein subunit alpha [Aequorivita sp.]